ncbi:TetR/AcrR family transcriptional regulator, partial [Streptococcus suis]
IDSLHMGTWVVATGVAALMTSGIIHPSEEQIIHLMKDSIEAILERDEPIDIDL